MSVLRRTRVLLLIALFAAPILRADYPAGRVEPRLVYNPLTSTSILFGGRTPLDRATGKAYELNETWSWDGARWSQLYPATVPPVRTAQVMVWDSTRNQVIMFGGEVGTTQLDDTWVYRNNDWKKVDTPNTPGTRTLAGGDFDTVRGRLLVYGGNRISSDGRRYDALRDTWEFDGSTWTQVGTNGPDIIKPIVAYDVARDRMIMLGSSTASAVSMWGWDRATGTWSEIKPTLLPPCANEAGMVFQSHNQTVALIGGLCATSAAAEEVYEWNGENFVKVTSVQSVSRLFGHAMAYDARRAATITYGGTTSGGQLNTTTHTFAKNDWIFHFDGGSPSPRSLFAIEADPTNGTIWMYGGVTESGTVAGDLWRYQNGDWNQQSIAGTPEICGNPISTIDTDRNRFILMCSTSELYELDLAEKTWKPFAPSSKSPVARRWAQLAYDPQLKKTVLYGGFDDLNYRNDTWLWDGANWTEITKNRVPARTLHSMWYDQNLKKVVVYGGLGRPSSEERIQRYDDMYSFDGSGWVKMNITTPGARYGAQSTVDPRTKKAILFGGILFEQTSEEDPGKQTFVDDFWEFDGTAWKKLQFNRVPTARENGAIEFDPSRNQLIVFGGYAATFFSDVWSLDEAHAAWNPRVDVVVRRRAGGLVGRP